VSTASSSERYDEALDQLLAFRPAVIAATRELLASAPDFPMGWVLAGYLGLSSTDAADVRHARAALDTLDSLAGPSLAPREAAHRDVLAAWVGGDWHRAAARLDDLLVRWPDDLLGLMMGHQLDFFLGDAQNLRDRVGRSLHAVDPAHPRHGFVRGMYAFGLEESGHYGLAREHGLAALDRNPGDVWALHAVVHTHEMEGTVDEGLRLMRARSDDWAGESLFSVHNWWHFALYLLEAGLVDEVLGVYDAQIHNASSDGVPLEMLDGSALLWRLLLDGADTGGRFEPLASAWADRVGPDAGADPWYVFNDLHAVVAFAGARRLDDARAVVDRLDRYVAGAPQRTSNVMMTAEIGLPACRAVVAFAEDRHDDVVAALMPIRRVLQRFGGSHAQRDVLQRTLLDAAIRSGRSDLAEALVSERLAVRGTSVYALGRWAGLLRDRGDTEAAERAETDAATHRSRFAAAA
jgi:hypothetical protein